MRISLSAGEFEYVDSGDPAAPPAVLLHGLRGNATRWDLVAPQLAKHRRVLALDQRGHGASVRTPSYSYESLVDDLTEFVDHLGLETFLLVGHSMGGTVAAIYAEQYADRLTGLVLVDSVPPDGDGDWTVPPRPAEELDFDWDCLVAIFAQMATPDPAWQADLAKITTPTLILGGGSTSPAPQHLLAEAAATIPDCTLVSIEGAGHTIHQTRPAEFLAALAARFPPPHLAG
ncbi:alpha/beta fold hydrolase [Kribbella sp. NPDC058245]|uniref:alpha/beta fold hydrolase n=1 Tax=Kribbella sp. NPDC058245 TaxID=3346399 RepID=UPI0036EB458D